MLSTLAWLTAVAWGAAVIALLRAEHQRWRADAWRGLASRNNRLFAELRDRHRRALIVVAAAQAWHDGEDGAHVLCAALEDWEAHQEPAEEEG
jgi:hypothetical protein